MKTKLLLLVALCACFSCTPSEEPQDNSITLSEESLEIDFEETYPLQAQFNREGYDVSDLVWESANDSIALVDQTGLITGNKAGETTITVRTADGQFNASCLVRVFPTNFLFEEPIREFGVNQDHILEHENREMFLQIPDVLLFHGENQHLRYLNYRFNDEGEFYQCFLTFNRSYGLEQDIYFFLSQRYNILGFDGRFYQFENEDFTVTLAYNEEMEPLVYYLPK